MRTVGPKWPPRLLVAARGRKRPPRFICDGCEIGSRIGRFRAVQRCACCLAGRIGRFGRCFARKRGKIRAAASAPPARLQLASSRPPADLQRRLQQTPTISRFPPARLQPTSSSPPARLQLASTRVRIHPHPHPHPHPHKNNNNQTRRPFRRGSTSGASQPKTFHGASSVWTWRGLHRVRLRR
jgi:hypothetical protein